MRSHFLALPALVVTLALIHARMASAAESGPAAADAADDAQSGSAEAPREALQEVVVTARRRAESLTDVPISVTALSSEGLSSKGLTQVDDLQYATPALKFAPAAGRQNNSTYEIRGIGTLESLITQDPAVGIYVNDVYRARATGTNQSFYDIENVQVLYGPQGTLFGRNSSAGAVLINTKLPTNRLEGELEAGFGNLGLYNITGILNLPISDTLAIRFAGQRVKRDGYGTDITTGRKFGDEDTTSGRVSVRWTPSDSFDNSAVLSYYEANENGSLAIISGFRPCNLATFTPPASCLYNPAVSPLPSAGDLAAAYAAQLQRGPYLTAYDAGQHEYDKPLTLGVSNTSQYKINDQITVKNILGYNRVRYLVENDVDGTPIPVISPNTLDSRVHQISEELQLQGNMPRLNWVAGALYFDERGRDIQTGNQLVPFYPLNPYQENTFGINKSYAAFAQGTYEIADRLHFTAGARYSWDKRSAEYEDTYNFGTPQQHCTFDAVTAPNCHVQVSKNFGKPTYTLSLDYKLTPDSLVYLTTRQGYRSGGFNPRAQIAAQLTPFDPETVRDVEAGYKGNFRLSNGIRFHGGISAYNSWYNDIQRQVAVQLPGGTATTNIVNAATARIKGFESDFGIAPVRWADLSVFWGYVDGVYGTFESGGVTFSNIAFPTSRNSAGATLTLTPIDNDPVGRVSLVTTYSYRSAYLSDETLPVLEPESRAPAQKQLNMTLSWDEIWGSGVSVEVFGRNLTNEVPILSILGLSSLLGESSAVIGPPRTYGVTVKYKFGGTR